MVNYNPKDWINTIFRFHKADTTRKLFPLMIVVCIYSAIIAHIEINVLHLTDKSYLKNIPLMHSLLGIVISILLVFRTNTAYDRWWEGRKLWGSLVNNSRNLAMKLSAMLPPEEQAQRTFFRKMIPAFAHALHTHLKSEETRTALFEKAIAKGHLTNIDTGKHIPNQIAAKIFRHIQKLYADKTIDGNQLIILNEELRSFTDICGACERIKNTPIPFSYSVFIKKFIFTYVATLPIGYVFSLGFWVIPVVAFVFYVLASMELIAEEIEDPFGQDYNDVPTHQIADNIQKHVEEIL
jgi:ion channel-forming bestrophin family protein